MADAFDERARAAYEAQGLDRERDFAQGLLLSECFVLDSDGVKAVGRAAGAAGPAFRIADNNYLSGVPGEDETLNCSLGSTGARLAVIAGTTRADGDGRSERVAPTRLEWVSDGFIVTVTGPEDLLGGKRGFAALSAAVENVERTLSA